MADSYTFEGLKWGSPTLGTPSGDITWTVDWSGLAGYAGASASYDAALAKAMAAWEGAASITFADAPLATGAPDVAISFGYIDGTPATNNTVALTSWMYPAGYSSGLYSPDHMTLVFDNSETWNPSAGPNLDFTSVAMHELGHVIGLDHTPGDPSEIMYPSVSTNTTQESLGQGDIYGAQVIYGRDATDPEIADPGGASDPVAVAASHGGGSGMIAAIVGLVLALIGGISLGVGAAAAAAMKLDSGGDDHDGDGHDAADGHDGVLHEIHAYDLADVIPVTGVHGDEAHAAVADTPEDDTHHGVLSLL